MTKPTDINKNATAASRRRFLREGGALLGGAVIAGDSPEVKHRAGSANCQQPPAQCPGMDEDAGRSDGKPALWRRLRRSRRMSSRISRRTLTQYLSASGRTPLQDLDGIITPNGLFYERHHGGVPTIDPAQHRLMLHGLVDRPLIFTMDDIRRFPSESHIHFLECSGNPGYKKPYGKTASDLVGLLSCAEWTGRQPEAGVAGSRFAAGRKMGRRRRRRCRRDDAQHSDREMPR